MQKYYDGKDTMAIVSIPSDYVMPDILAFSKMEDEKVDRFLMAYKNTGARQVELKVVHTKLNFSWSVYELIEDMKRQRRLYI